MEPIRVDWVSGSPFFDHVSRLTARAARNCRGEPDEALGYVWEHLRKKYDAGSIIDMQGSMLATIVSRKVKSFYRGRDKPLQFRAGFDPLDEVEEAPRSRTKPPSDDVADRELRAALDAGIAALDPRRREAVLVKLELDVRGVNELAQCWGTTPQNVHKLAKKGIQELRTSLSRFA